MSFQEKVTNPLPRLVIVFIIITSHSLLCKAFTFIKEEAVFSLTENWDSQNRFPSNVTKEGAWCFLLWWTQTLGTCYWKPSPPKTQMPAGVWQYSLFQLSSVIKNSYLEPACNFLVSLTVSLSFYLFFVITLPGNKLCYYFVLPTLNVLLLPAGLYQVQFWIFQINTYHWHIEKKSPLQPWVRQDTSKDQKNQVPLKVSLVLD